jgi:hypothetical protein
MKGIIPVHRWIGPEELIGELTARGLELWEQQGSGEWRPFVYISRLTAL